MVVLAGALLAGPTSLNRGEGLRAGLTCEVGGGEGSGGGRRRKDERISTVMGFDVRFKLRLST